MRIEFHAPTPQCAIQPIPSVHSCFVAFALQIQDSKILQGSHLYPRFLKLLICTQVEISITSTCLKKIHVNKTVSREDSLNFTIVDFGLIKQKIVHPVNRTIALLQRCLGSFFLASVSIASCQFPLQFPLLNSTPYLCHFFGTTFGYLESLVDRLLPSHSQPRVTAKQCYNLLRFLSD